MASASLAPYCLFIYSRSGKLLFHREWRAQKSTESGPSQQAQLLFGVLTTLALFRSPAAGTAETGDTAEKVAA